MTEKITDAPPSAPADFWRIPDLQVLRPPEFSNMPSALERLGASPFPKSRFPFLGFLATVYDHIASQIGAASGGEKSDVASIGVNEAGSSQSTR